MLTAALDELAVPPRAQLVEESRGGNVLCFDACFYASRHHRVPQPPGEVVDDLMAEARAAGYGVEPTPDLPHASPRP